MNEDVLLKVAAYFQNGAAVARSLMKVVLGIVHRYLQASPRNPYEDVVFSAVTALGSLALTRWPALKKLVLT